MKVHKDKRGLFVIGQGSEYDQMFVADSKHKFTFRGLHYQTDPLQVKTVKILKGKVLDFLYDINTGEFKEYYLDPDSELLVIDKNYAHGYLTLEPDTTLVYGVKGQFNPNTYSTIYYGDIEEVKNRIVDHLGLDFKSKLVISDKDDRSYKDS